MSFVFLFFAHKMHVTSYYHWFLLLFLRQMENWESKTNAVIQTIQMVLLFFFVRHNLKISSKFNIVFWPQSLQSVIISVWATHVWECFYVYSLRVSVFIFIFVETINYLVRLKSSFLNIANLFSFFSFTWIFFFYFIPKKRLIRNVKSVAFGLIGIRDCS